MAAMARSYTEGVIEQLPSLALQMVLAVPGARGLKVMLALVETAAELMVPVIEPQASLEGAGKPEKLVVTATIAWFM